MNRYLFEEPLANLVEQKIAEAQSKADQLTPQDLEGPDLGEILQKIATFSFEVASLKPDLRKGKRRTERQKRTDYGRDIVVDVDFIDVKIPFDGWPKSFQLAPSSRRLIDTPATINSDATVEVSFPDDNNLEGNLNAFIEGVTQNLSNLRSELRRVPAEMLQAAQLVANRRLQQVRERKERDKTRSFPID